MRAVERVTTTDLANRCGGAGCPSAQSVPLCLYDSATCSQQLSCLSPNLTLDACFVLTPANFPAFTVPPNVYLRLEAAAVYHLTVASNCSARATILQIVQGCTRFQFANSTSPVSLALVDPNATATTTTPAPTLMCGLGCCRRRRWVGSYAAAAAAQSARPDLYFRGRCLHGPSGVLPRRLHDWGLRDRH